MAPSRDRDENDQCQKTGFKQLQPLGISGKFFDGHLISFTWEFPVVWVKFILAFNKPAHEIVELRDTPIHELVSHCQH